MGSSWQRRPYRLKFALASLSGITFMVPSKLLTADEQCATAFLADQNDRHLFLVLIDVERLSRVVPLAQDRDPWSNPELRKLLKAEGLMTRDARQKERKKYGQKGARKRFQFSKR